MQGDFPTAAFDLLQKQMATMGRVGATRFYQTPSIVSPAAAGGISTPSTIRFTQKGIALAMYGQELAGTAPAFAQTAVRCQIGGTEDLFLDGQGGYAFLPMLLLFGGVCNWQPLMRKVTPGVDWTFTFRNDTVSDTINPQVVIAFIADNDVAAMAQK